MPRRTQKPFTNSCACAFLLAVIGGAAPLNLMASPFADAELKKMLTIKPVSEAEIFAPGRIDVRYSEDETILIITVLNGDDGIDFVAQFQSYNITLEDLNHWNATTYFQAFRADADRVRVNTRIFLPKDGIGDVLPTSGYIGLTYVEFANAVHRFHDYLVARQSNATASQPAGAPTSVTSGGTPSTAPASNPLTDTPATTPVAAPIPSTPGSGSSTAAPSADSQQKQWTFPEINEAFSRRSELQREPFANSVKGSLLSGQGSITEVGRCGFMDDSKRHGKNCLKITLDNDQPRAVLYFPKSRQDELAALEVGDGYRFSNCTVISITDYGFWTTVICDMP